MRLLCSILLALAILPRTTQADETIVFLSPNGPFFVGVALTVDKQDFRDWLTRYLFDRLDADRNSRLTANEIEDTPQRLVTRLGAETGKQLASQFEVSEEGLSKAEFVKSVRERLPTAFLISEKEQPAVQTINILPRFDANNDGHLSAKELEDGLKHQAQQDIDDDETLSAAELLPFRDPLTRFRPVAPDPENLPFIQVVEGSEDKLAKRLVKYYADGQSGTKLNAAGMRLPEKAFAKADTNSDGQLGDAELTKFLKQPAHHIVMAVQFPRRGRAKMQFETLVKDEAVTVAYAKREFLGDIVERKDQVVLALDGLPITIQTTKHRTSDARFTRSFCGQRFSLSDKDMNGYLDDKEFPEFSGAVAANVGMMTFGDLDFDENEMVTREELNRHLDRDVIASQSQLEVTVASDGKSMFQMLDENRDRRLSQRELKSGFDKIASLDRDSDRRVSRLEASSPSQYTLEIGLGRAQLMRVSNQNMQMMDSTNAVIRGTDRLEGPLWFRKMDRNRDGDVSLREFLGTQAQFAKLDKDADGLLDATEAEATPEQ